MNINRNFKKLPDAYIFAELAEKVKRAKAVSKRRIIDLGVGDVKLPLPKIFADEMKRAAAETAEKDGFRGYPPAGGYDFLKRGVAENYFLSGADIDEDEIFVTDGAKSELGNVTELFEKGAKVLFPTPCYPAAAETNILLGNEVFFLPTDAENDFIPEPPYGKTFDLIYLCSPNNPTGSAFDRSQLKNWVDYALYTGAVIIYDGAYSAYVSKDRPKTVYEIRGAKKCAIEIRSFSKSLGFTGIRCGFTTVPKELGSLNALMKRRVGARFNGVSYISQRGAAVCFTPEGAKKTEERINFYKTNASALKIALKNKNLWYNNSCSSPYVYVKSPDGLTSDGFSALLLDNCGICSAPARGFLSDVNFVRLSAFATREDILEAAERINDLSL